MSNGDYRGLRLASRAGDPEPETTPEDAPEDENSPDGKKKKDTQMSDKTFSQADIDKASADATTAANERFSKVLASEHYAGREKLAQNLLGNAALSADQIIAALADAPKTEAKELTAEEAAAAAEAGGRAAMQEALAENENSDAAPSAGGGKPNDQVDAGPIWDQAIASLSPGQKAA